MPSDGGVIAAPSTAPPVPVVRPFTHARPGHWLWPALATLALMGGCATAVLTYAIVQQDTLILQQEAQISEWDTTRAGLEAQINLLRQQADIARNDISALATRKQEVQQQIASLDQQRLDKEQDAQRLGDDVRQLGEKVEALNGHRGTLALQIVDLENKYQELSQNITLTERRVHDLDQQRERIVADLEKTQTQRAHSRARSASAAAARRRQLFIPPARKP